MKFSIRNLQFEISLLQFILHSDEHCLPQNHTQVVNLLQGLMDILFPGLMGHHDNGHCTIDLPSFLNHCGDADIILPQDS